MNAAETLVSEKQAKQSLDYSLKIDLIESDKLSPAEFQSKYLLSQKPVIIRGLLKNEPAYTKWTMDYFKKTLGHETVGYFGKAKDKVDRSYKKPHDFIQFGDYLDEIAAGPSDKRLFLFDIFKIDPELKKDFEFPKLTNLFLKNFRFTFFGGKGSVVRIHQDIDMSNVFLTQFHGRKRVILFAPKYSELLYRFPLNTHTPIDIAKPDFEKFPGLKYVKGYECIIEEGDTLFMPSGYWHYIEYVDGGFAMALRSLSPYYSMRFKGFLNVAIKTHIDEFLLAILGKAWFNWKQKKAFQRAEIAIKKAKLKFK